MFVGRWVYMHVVLVSERSALFFVFVSTGDLNVNAGLLFHLLFSGGAASAHLI